MKKIIIILLLVLISFSLLDFISRNSRLDLKPSANLSENVSSFEQKENLFFRYEIIRYPSSINVTDFNPNETKTYVGMSGDRTNFNFGFIPRSSSSRKSLNLTNNQVKSYQMKFFVFGNISELVKLGRSLVLKPGENVEVPVRAQTNLGTPIGIYTGEVDVVTVLPKNSLSRIIQMVV